jgi:hypothetical protein
MSLHPYTQVEIIQSFQEEKRRELLKLREAQTNRVRRPSLVRRLLYNSGSTLIAAGNTLKHRAEPRFGNL